MSIIGLLGLSLFVVMYIFYSIDSWVFPKTWHHKAMNRINMLLISLCIGRGVYELVCMFLTGLLQ